MKKADIKAIVGRADLHIKGTVKRSEGGLPIGNGPMATLVWTSPTALKTQINRADVFSNDSTSNSFNDRHLDYGYGCAFVDIDFASFGQDVFGPDTLQHLDLYKAEGKILGEGISTRFFACEGLDAFVFEAEDARSDPESVQVRLKMLRMPEVREKSQLAISRYYMVDDIIVLKQEFTEDDFYCASAVAVKVCGRPAKMRYLNEDGGKTQGVEGREVPILGAPTETEMRLSIKPGKGVFQVVVSSAATFDRGVDVVKQAAETAAKTAQAGAATLKEQTEAEWKKFWEKSYIALWGDEDAALVETHYQYFMYVMGCCSKNSKYPPNYGGMLFLTRGDPRLWGAMQWWNNLSLYYNPMAASGHYELLMPYFSQWNAMLPRLRTYARQQWDSQGLFIPETLGFDGPEVLTDEMAKEMSDLMLQRKPWSARSEAFKRMADKKRPHEARWNFVNIKAWEKGELTWEDRGLYAAVTHMMGSQVGIAHAYYEYYRYSGDKEYLRQYGYPIIQGIAEFFRSYPNVRKDADGKYHIYGTNSSEGFWGSKDSMESMVAMHAIYPMAIACAGELGVDENLIPLWQERLDNLAPLPDSSHPDFESDALPKDPPVWVNAVGQYGGVDHEVIMRSFVCPIKLGDFCTLETSETDPALYEMAERWLETVMRMYGPSSRQMVFEMSSMARIYANMGKGEALRQMLVHQLNCINADKEYCSYGDNGRVPVFENRLTSREGVNAMSAQRLGNAAAGIQRGLLQSGGGSITAPGVLRLFPALPGGWNARFRLHAADGFIVEAASENGVPTDVTITSTLGKDLRVKNPWNSPYQVKINGVAKGMSTDPTLCLETVTGDVIELTQA